MAAISPPRYLIDPKAEDEPRSSQASMLITEISAPAIQIESNGDNATIDPGNDIAGAISIVPKQEPDDTDVASGSDNGFDGSPTATIPSGNGFRLLLPNGQRLLMPRTLAAPATRQRQTDSPRDSRQEAVAKPGLGNVRLLPKSQASSTFPGIRATMRPAAPGVAQSVSTAASASAAATATATATVSKTSQLSIVRSSTASAPSTRQSAILNREQSTAAFLEGSSQAAVSSDVPTTSTISASVTVIPGRSIMQSSRPSTSTQEPQLVSEVLAAALSGSFSQREPTWSLSPVTVAPQGSSEIAALRPHPAGNDGRRQDASTSTPHDWSMAAKIATILESSQQGGSVAGSSSDLIPDYRLNFPSVEDQYGESVQRRALGSCCDVISAMRLRFEPPSTFHLLTGLDTGVFDALAEDVQASWELLKAIPNEETGEVKLERLNNRVDPHQDELLLTLIKLKTNFPAPILAHLFGCESEVAIDVLQYWIPFLAEWLRPFISWPLTRSWFKRSMPTSIQKDFGEETSAVLDIVEVKLAFNDYTEETTSAKFAVVYNWSGAITYRSRLFDGVKTSHTDVAKAIAADLGLFDRKKLWEVWPDKYVVSDRSCLVSQRCIELDKAKNAIARLTSRLRHFAILHEGTFPAGLVPCVDDIVTICCGLVNLNPIATETVKRKGRPTTEAYDEDDV